MKKMKWLGLMISTVICTSASANEASFLDRDQPYAIRGNKAMYLYVGDFDTLTFRGATKKVQSKSRCSLRLEVEFSPNGPQIIGVAGIDFNFTNIEGGESLKVHPRSNDTLDIVYRLNLLRKSTYSLSFDELRRLTSFVLNNDDAAVGAFLMNGWTGDFAQNCTNMQNISDLSQMSNVWDSQWIIEHKEKFLTGYK